METDKRNRDAAGAFLMALAMTIVRLDDAPPTMKTTAHLMAQLDADLTKAVKALEMEGVTDIADSVERMRERFREIVSAVKLGTTPTNTRSQ